MIRLRQYARRKWLGLHDDSGQTLIVAALCMIILIAFLGLAIDVGQLRLTKRNLQVAADAAAIAAGLEVRICGSTPNCPAMQVAAQKALAENGFTTSTLLANCASNTSSTLTLTVNNPPCQLGAADPSTSAVIKNSYVEVVLSQQQRTFFSRIVGFDNVPVTVRAEAVRSNTAPCIYALDPSASGAISVLVGVGFRSACGIVDESSSSSAIVCIVGALISAPKISVTGKTAGLLCGSNPPATTGVPVPNPADPLAYLPPPPTANDACPKTTSLGPIYTGSASGVSLTPILGAQVVFNPGVYCGGISITAAVLSSVTFNPGTYVIRQAPGLLGPTGGLSIAAGLLASITGQGVTFYNEGQVGGFSVTATSPVSLSNFNLSAPTSGEYSGILFFQAHGATSPGTYLVDLLQGSKLEGAIYEPDALVSYGVSAVSNSYSILVAKDLNFTAPVLSTIGNDYVSLTSGSPLGGDSATLVQ